MGKLYDKDGKFTGYYQGLEDGLVSSKDRPQKTEQPTDQKKTPKDELDLKYAVELAKLELQRENSDKNRGLLFFALILLAAFVVGYCLFR